jgi:AcrR family transcriptional regulator
VRAFGGKDALLDAAVSGLLEPVVRRAWALLEETSPDQALRTFLAELIVFQSAHHAISDQLGGLNLPATTALRAELGRSRSVLRDELGLETSPLLRELEAAILRHDPPLASDLGGAKSKWADSSHRRNTGH